MLIPEKQLMFFCMNGVEGYTAQWDKVISTSKMLTGGGQA